MGLDAVVYKRLEEVTLPHGVNLDSLRVEEITGEVYFENDEVSLSREDIRAVSKRLGNMALINSLRDQISDLFGPRSRSSILVAKILYDGTHAGDVIAIEDLDHLKQEISLVREKNEFRKSREMAEFLSAMDELIVASERHGNPIVFI